MVIAHAIPMKKATGIMRTGLPMSAKIGSSMLKSENPNMMTFLFPHRSERRPTGIRAKMDPMKNVDMTLPTTKKLASRLLK